MPATNASSECAKFSALKYLGCSTEAPSSPQITSSLESSELVDVYFGVHAVTLGATVQPQILEKAIDRAIASITESAFASDIIRLTISQNKHSDKAKAATNAISHALSSFVEDYVSSAQLLASVLATSIHLHENGWNNPLAKTVEQAADLILKARQTKDLTTLRTVIDAIQAIANSKSYSLVAVELTKSTVVIGEKQGLEIVITNILDNPLPTEADIRIVKLTKKSEVLISDKVSFFFLL